MGLKVISGGLDAPKEWAQLRDEDETEYLLFLGWLHAGDPRGAPDYPAIAGKYRWTERANAYDSTHALPSTPTGKAARGWRDLEDIFCAEARKLASDVKKATGDRLLTPKEVMAIGVMLADNRDALKRILEADDADTVDVTALDDDELRAIQAAQKALKKIGGKK